jgi:hypothetical protein
MAGRDDQRGRVYAWENAHVGPRDPTMVAFAEAQAMVDAIWADRGLRFPPRVEALSRRSSAVLAQASRLVLYLPPATPSWCILHELAHTMSMTHDDRSDGHGPVFMGLYVQLLERYMRLPAAGLMETLGRAGIRVECGARPVFVDE